MKGQGWDGVGGSVAARLGRLRGTLKEGKYVHGCVEFGVKGETQRTDWREERQGRSEGL